MLKGIPSRSLQQGDANVTNSKVIVNTAEELKDALEDAATHIEIQGHLNLTSLPVFDSVTNYGPSWSTVLGSLPPSTQSIRVCISFFNPLY